MCTLHRQKIVNLSATHEAFRNYALRGVEKFNIAVGRYVFLPDHLHLFVRGGPEFSLGKWIKALKRTLLTAMKTEGESALWQPGFFDHLLRNDESYSGKWEYVRNNPVRHGLVASPDDWPNQGEIVYIERA